MPPESKAEEAVAAEPAGHEAGVGGTAGTEAADAGVGHETGTGGSSERVTPGDDPRDGATSAPARTVELVATLRFAWATLTSMRTALILLFVLGIAAIPGSLLPQRPQSPVAVSDYLRDNPGAGPWLDRLGFFDVFAAPWFAAIYLLLFISLIGCIVPRIRLYARALTAPPSPAPGRLARLPEHRRADVAGAPADVLDAAEAHLRSRRYRVRRTAGAIAGERGYSREAGNLVFHVSLVVVLVGLAWASLFGYRGTAVVVEGQAFSNTLTQYDDFGAGAAFRADQVEPFTVALDSFEVRFETGPVQRGAARLFRASVTLTDAHGVTSPHVLEVNQPLSVGGTTVHLLGHGYAPVVTVRDGNDDVVLSGPVVFVPQDGNFTSHGVIKAPDARPERLAFEGVFLPTAVVDPVNGVTSVFPDALNPELLVNVWVGPPKEETGRPENVFILDPTGLTQLTRPNGDPIRVGLSVGESYALPDGRGSVSLDGWRRWTKLQISTTPGAWLILAAVLTGVLGLSVSLTGKPRRLFVRVHQGAVEVAGLDRVDGRDGLAGEVAALAAACGAPTTLAPDPTSDPEERQ